MTKRTSIAIAIVVLTAMAIALPEPGAAATKLANAQRSAKQIAAELAAVNAQSKSAGRKFDSALWNLENTDDRIKATDRRIKAESTRLAAAEVLLGERIAAMYRSGDDSGGAVFLLGASTFEDFITRADLVSMIGDRDAALVADVKATRASLQRNRAELTKTRQRQAVQTALFRKNRDVLNAKLNSVKTRYAILLGQLAAAMAREKAAGLITWAPKGPNGMVFPVRGTHYYSNTWGAARSGGRTHKGTDIMSPRGTPCVAVSAGTVRAHDSSLGGLSITLTGVNGWSYYYAHLNAYVVRSGHVGAGQLIGYVGATGNARGGAPHLHFQMGPGGRWVNPYSYLRSME